MRTKTICYFILALFIIVAIACGDSDDEGANQLKKPTTQTKETGEEIIVPEEEEVIDFAAEEAAIRGLYISHAAAISGKGADEIMEHWIQRNTKDVFMTQCVLGAVTILEKWKGIKDSWVPTFQLLGGQPKMTVTIAKVGIDKRGQEATLSGNYNWGGIVGKSIAAFEKDKKGNWKIRAIDLCEQNLIKEIQTPQK
ncbi:TPA: hypothetical protein EYP66_11595 [Candidatus Poribacteria bacterium]|nr:hypothetical protein [Candidatus Poribacteria bacterium]